LVAIRIEMNLSANPQSNLPRVILVDDHPAMLRQTTHVLSKSFEVVAVFGDGRDLLPLAKHGKIDAIVLDITLPGLSGIELAGRIKKAGFSGKIIFLTVHADPDYAREALEVGGSGYVVKPRLASDLIPALEAALKGQIFVSPCAELQDSL
jgi:DNA-binding NarL/FixJ family response regulator